MMTRPRDFLSDEAIATLISKTRPQLENSLLRMLSLSDVEDVLQDTYLKIFLVLQQQSIDNIEAFTYRVARNIAIDKLRQYQRQETTHRQIEHDLQLVHSRAESDVSVQVHLQTELSLAIQSLPASCRQVFIARRIHGLSHKEIAELLSISVKTVENHLSKALKRLRQSLIERGAKESRTSSREDR